MTELAHSQPVDVRSYIAKIAHASTTTVNTEITLIKTVKYHLGELGFNFNPYRLSALDIYSGVVRNLFTQSKTYEISYSQGLSTAEQIEVFYYLVSRTEFGHTERYPHAYHLRRRSKASRPLSLQDIQADEWLINLLREIAMKTKNPLIGERFAEAAYLVPPLPLKYQLMRFVPDIKNNCLRTGTFLMQCRIP